MTFCWWCVSNISLQERITVQQSGDLRCFAQYFLKHSLRKFIPTRMILDECPSSYVQATWQALLGSRLILFINVYLLVGPLCKQAMFLAFGNVMCCLGTCPCVLITLELQKTQWEKSKKRDWFRACFLPMGEVQVSHHSSVQVQVSRKAREWARNIVGTVVS